MSLARSLLQAWADPLMVLSHSANTLPHPAQSTINNKIQELQEHSKSLGDGLDILSNKVGKYEDERKCSFPAAVIIVVEIFRSFTLTMPPSALACFFHQMGPAAQAISSLPYRGANDLGQDKISKLVHFNFLLSCLRRDSHKIDSFLKVLRCRAARMQPEQC